MRDHQCFSLENTPAAKGILAWLSMWSQFIGRTTGALEWTAGDNEFHGNMEYMELSHLKIFWATSSPFSVRRVSSSPCVSFSRGIKVMLQVQGNTSIIQNGKTVELGPGHWVVYDAGSPYEVINHSDFEQITLMVPRESLSARRDVKIAPLFQAHPSAHGLGKVFWEFLKNVMQESNGIGMQCERSVASAVECMLMQLLSNVSPLIGPTTTVDIKEAINSHINDNLHDPELSLESIARALGTTKRTLHRAYESEDESISDRVWRMRIQRCQQVLDHAATDWSVTELAFAHGFKDPAHFSRRFKQFTGISPRSYQEQVLLGDRAAQ
jgi:AraC-like DNA-binding protein